LIAVTVDCTLAEPSNSLGKIMENASTKGYGDQHEQPAREPAPSRRVNGGGSDDQNNGDSYEWIEHIAGKTMRSVDLSWF